MKKSIQTKHGVLLGLAGGGFVVGGGIAAARVHDSDD